MTYDEAVTKAKAEIEKDPFFGESLRKFLFACKLVLTSAETGKGTIFIQNRFAAEIKQFVKETTDYTGMIQAIMAEVEPALVKVLAR
jgi:hypothetical protein